MRRLLPALAIKSIRDLEGSRLGSPAGGASFKLLPLLAKQNGIDYSKIGITQLSPSLQEQIPPSGTGRYGHGFYTSLVSLKHDPDKDFRWMYYSDLDLYSNGIMVSPKLAREHPEAVKGSEARELGTGDVSDIGLKSEIATIAASFELSPAPPPGDIFDRSFLPAKADPMPPVIVP